LVQGPEGGIGFSLKIFEFLAEPFEPALILGNALAQFFNFLLRFLFSHRPSFFESKDEGRLTAMLSITVG
jgi:hypothetical protein